MDDLAQAILDVAAEAAPAVVETEAAPTEAVAEAAPAEPGTLAAPETTEAPVTPATPATPATGPRENIFSDAAIKSLLTDDALKTPEGLKSAADALQQRARDLQKYEYGVKKRSDSVKEKVHRNAAERDALTKERETISTFAKQLQTDVAALQRGSAKEIIATLGRLSNRDPHELYREISLLMATDGKTNGKANPELEAVKAELAELKRAREQEAAQATEAAQAQAIEAAKDRIYSAASSPEKFPSIARFVSTAHGGRDEAREWLANWVIAQYNATGERPTDEAAAQELEQQLLAVTQPAGTTGAPVAKSATGQAPSKPKPAVSLTSADSSAPAQRKPRTGGYTTEELAADDSFMAALF